MPHHHVLLLTLFKQGILTFSCVFICDVVYIIIVFRRSLFDSEKKKKEIEIGFDDSDFRDNLCFVLCIIDSLKAHDNRFIHVHIFSTFFTCNITHEIDSM